MDLCRSPRTCSSIRHRTSRRRGTEWRPLWLRRAARPEPDFDRTAAERLGNAARVSSLCVGARRCCRRTRRQRRTRLHGRRRDGLSGTAHGQDDHAACEHERNNGYESKDRAEVLPILGGMSRAGDTPADRLGANVDLVSSRDLGGADCLREILVRQGIFARHGRQLLPERCHCKSWAGWKVSTGAPAMTDPSSTQ